MNSNREKESSWNIQYCMETSRNVSPFPLKLRRICTRFPFQNYSTSSKIFLIFSVCLFKHCSFLLSQFSVLSYLLAFQLLRKQLTIN